MSEIYGKRWFTENGGQPSQMWINSLIALSVADVKRAMEICRTIGDQYPVTLSQFVGRVRDSKSRAENRVYKSLPRPKADKAVAKRHIAELKRSISSAKNSEAVVSSPVPRYRVSLCECGCNTEDGIYPDRPVSQEKQQ